MKLSREETLNHAIKIRAAVVREFFPGSLHAAVAQLIVGTIQSEMTAEELARALDVTFGKAEP